MELQSEIEASNIVTVNRDEHDAGAAFEAALRISLRSDLITWASFAVAHMGQRPAPHHLLLLRHLEGISRGETDRLMVLMPPGSAKSTYASVLFPPWWFAQHAHTSVIGASHTAGLAGVFSRRVRAMIEQHSARLGYAISPTDRSTAHWRTTSGGEYYAAGARGSFTGRRADLLIIDDPVKSQEEADNPNLRERLWSWYQSDLTTRLKPGARIVLIMTRWHEDDLGGRLLAQSASDWTVLRLPAIAEVDDPLGRAPGTPLWPEWEDLADLARKRLSVGERTWSALFQQTPLPQTDGLFDVSKIRTVDGAGSETASSAVRAWDLAGTPANGTNDPDWTVGVKLAQGPDGSFTVLDIVRVRATSQEVQDLIVRTANSDGTEVRVGLPEDPGQAGKSQAAHLVGRLSGYLVSASREKGSKASRAQAVASQVDVGNLVVVRAKWNHAFLDELKQFPFGRKDDQVDALSRAFDLATSTQKSAHKMRLPFLTR